MKKIDRIKQDGAEQALRSHIDSLQHKLRSVWTNTKSYTIYIRLDEAMDEAACIMSEMRDTFKELKKLNNKNK